MSTTWQIRPDDLSSDAVRALIAQHLNHMYEMTPAESVHALDLTSLQGPDITMYTAWDGETLGGMAAVRRHDEHNAELKSMRTTDAARGRGAGRALLRHIIAATSNAGVQTLWLETGVEDGFIAARGLYASEGFVECGPFADYTDDPLSVFMTRPSSS